MLDSLGKGFDVAKHHCCRGSAAQIVPHAVDFQPVVGETLAAGDQFSHSINQDLATTTGQATQAGFLEAGENGF